MARSGTIQSLYLGISAQVDERDFVLVMPDGTINSQGDRYWDTGAPCCGDGTVDDVGYLTDLINEAKAEFNIDDDRVYLVGHSNGGFMAFTMACERSELITAIMSLAGSSFTTAPECSPRTEPVGVLQVCMARRRSDHPLRGRAGRVPGGGGSRGRATPSSTGVSSARWSHVPISTWKPTFPETTRPSRIATRVCDSAMLVELWTVEGGGHIPIWNPNFGRGVLDWLFALSK